MKTRIPMMMAALGLALVLSGCKSDCTVACERKQECWRANTDVEECTTTCEQKSEDDQNFANQAEECAECVSKDLVCSELLNRCGDDCLSVVGF
jgi:hypothetical protein